MKSSRRGRNLQVSGYGIWYAALPSMTATSASIVQLAVPVLAAAGAAALLGEHLTTRLALSTIVIIGGVALAVLSKRAAARPSPVAAQTVRSE